MNALRLLFAISACAFAADEKLVVPIPPDTEVHVQKDLNYDGDLHFDLYAPARHNSPVPVVLFMNGVGGRSVRSWPQYTGWGKLVTGSGLAGVVYDAHEGGAARDTRALLQYLGEHGSGLGIDARNVILWACSSNVSEGLPLAMDASNSAIKAAVVYYGTAPVRTVRPDLPVLMVRAGLDGLGLNRGIGEFVAAANAANAPLTFINIPAAHHAFDLRDDKEISRAVIARTLDFMKAQAQDSAQKEISAGLQEAAAAGAVFRGDSATAVREYSAVAAARPRDAEVHRNFGNALLDAGQYQRALTEFQLALDLGNPNRGWIAYSAATASIKLGDSEAALQWVEKLKDIPPMWKQLKSDPNFAALGDNPRFKAVAEQH
jgi:acetyl esterase/lipase